MSAAPSVPLLLLDVRGLTSSSFVAPVVPIVAPEFVGLEEEHEYWFVLRHTYLPLFRGYLLSLYGRFWSKYREISPSDLSSLPSLKKELLYAALWGVEVDVSVFTLEAERLLSEGGGGAVLVGLNRLEYRMEECKCLDRVRVLSGALDALETIE